ncbi:MAG: RNA polymerase sigma factor [Candidatus Paceibacterota bacterium]
MKEMNDKIEKVFMESYEEFSDAIFRYSLFQTSNREIALDITQDTFTKTWQYLQKGEEVENIKAFLYRVAKNLIVDHRRKKKSSSLDEIMEAGIDFTEEENVLEEKEKNFDKEKDRQKLLKTIEKIDEKYKEILLMRYVEEMSIKEISEILDKSQNHTSVMIHRGVEKLKKIIKEYE